MELEARTVQIMIAPRRRSSEKSPRRKAVNAMVHVPSGLAYLPVPEGTVTSKKLPGSWMVINQRGSCVLCNPLPVDEATVKAVLCYLVEHPEAKVEEYVQVVGGQWAYLPAA